MNQNNRIEEMLERACTGLNCMEDADQAEKYLYILFKIAYKRGSTDATSKFLEQIRAAKKKYKEDSG